MSKEHFFPTSKEADFSPTDTIPQPEVRSEHTLWRADIIAKRYSQLPSFHQNIETALIEDMRHLCREDLLQEKSIDWSEDLSDRGIEGNGYDEIVTDMTQNYIAYCAKEFGDISRAVTEHAAMKEIESWALSTADLPGTFAIWISPPGPEYGGISSLPNWQAQEKFCSKINIKWAEKVIDSTTNTEKIVVKTMQLSGWPNVSQLVDFWEDLNHAPFPNDNPADVLTDLIGNITYFSDSRFTPEKMLAHVSDQFYKTQKDWEYAQEMPKVNTELFWRYEERLWQNFYLPKALSLLHRIPYNLSDDDPFWFSPKYEKIIQNLDLLFHFFYRHLRKEIGDKDGFTAIKQNLKLLEQQYKDDVQIRLYGKKVTQKKLDQHNHSVLTLISVTNRAVSVSQCGLLAPFTAPISAMKNASHMNFLKLNASGIKVGELSQLEKTVSQEYQAKLAEYQRIQTGNYQEAILRVNQKERHYMVPASFLEGKGCFVAEVDGEEVAMGPCDIPLDTIFDDPNENIVYRMDKYEFVAHSQKLHNYLFNTGIDEANELINQNKLLSLIEKEKAKELLEKLERKIFKPTIGLSDFVAGINPISDDAALYLPGQFILQLNASLNPVRFLEELVFSTSVFSESSAL